MNIMIVGASMGLGRALMDGLAQDGNTLYGVARRPPSALTSSLHPDASARQYWISAVLSHPDAASQLAASVSVSRDNPQGVLPQVLTASLSADAKALPAWLGVSLGDQGYAVVRVDKVLPREPGDAQRKTQEVQQYNQWWSAAEAQAYYDTLKEQFKVRMLVPAPVSTPTPSQ